jgi:hypothetical protein
MKDILAFIGDRWLERVGGTLTAAFFLFSGMYIMHLNGEMNVGLGMVLFGIIQTVITIRDY